MDRNWRELSTTLVVPSTEAAENTVPIRHVPRCFADRCVRSKQIRGGRTCTFSRSGPLHVGATFVDRPTGLPPTVEEVDRFTDTRRPEAYERLVDRLLNSPRFGERWARVWLDVARYADSAVTPRIPRAQFGSIVIGSSMQSMPICHSINSPSSSSPATYSRTQQTISKLLRRFIEHNDEQRRRDG